jgi:hypothetical protein
MIINIWRPIYRTVNGIKNIYQYDLIDDISLLKKGCKVSYLCDRCKSNEIKFTTSTVLINPNIVYNDFEKQTCRSCRSQISEYEMFLQGIIPSIIGGVDNLEILSSYENNSKGRKCSLSLEEILK